MQEKCSEPAQNDLCIILEVNMKNDFTNKFPSR